MLKAFWLGVVDGFKQKVLEVGRTWSDNQSLNESYDRGANIGEMLAKLAFWHNPKPD